MNMNGGPGGGMPPPLYPTGVDFSNVTQASNFLAEMLNDTYWQVVGNDHACCFWYGVVFLIGLAGLHNWTWFFIRRTRLRQANQANCKPARPSNAFTRALATLTAVGREATYLRWSPASLEWLRIPSFGSILLVAVYLAFIIGLEFTNNDVAGAQHYTALGVRAGWLAIAQLPLLILLAGKNNVIGLVTRTSYERLNVLHRWVARGLLLLATFHVGFQNYGWSMHGLVHLEWTTDTCPPTGIAAYAILLWMNLSTLFPLRYWSYEVFVMQHLITFFGFVIAIMQHLPSTALYTRTYIYIAVALYLVDRLIRSGRLVLHNASSPRASLAQMAGGVTAIRVSGTRIRSWTPGSWVLLSIPQFGLAQSHPATIMSTPASHGRDLVFLLRSHRGFTKRLLHATEKADAKSYVAVVDGTYGGTQADFASFNSAALVCGSTGVTFCLAILMDLAERAVKTTLPLRRIDFIWAVKEAGCIDWVNEELRQAFDALRDAGIEIYVRVFVTCVGELTEWSGGRLHGCRCDKSEGSCCCAGKIAASSESEEVQGTLLNWLGPLWSTGNDKEADIERNPNAYVQSGRPPLLRLLWDVVDQADGETGIAVCGPLGLTTSVRSAVVYMSDERAVHKGTGAQGIYLHVEDFGF